NALKAILRQDPDVVLVGEMRDLETIAAAITIAETGHLTFGTLHTNSCAQTINRIIDVFPTGQQSQVRAQLSLVLEGVLSQTLVPKVGGGRAMSMEIMVATPAIRNLIREEKIHQIYSSIQSGSKYGMQTMNQSLADLIRRRLITREDGMNRSTIPEELAQLLSHEGAAAGAAPAPAAAGTGSPLARRSAALGGHDDGLCGPPTGGGAGELEATDRMAAVAQLRARGVVATAVQEKKAKSGGLSFSFAKTFGGKVKDKDLAIYTRQFSTMVDAGLPIAQCLTILGEQ